MSDTNHLGIFIRPKIVSEAPGGKAVFSPFLPVACVAWLFWLGEQSDKGRRGQRNREEIGAGVT